MEQDDSQNEKQTLPGPKLASNLETKPIPKNDLIVGNTLDGRFLIIRDLTDDAADRGGIGLVYLAQDLKLLNKQVVIKILQETSLRNEDLARKFKHEKEALIRLDHPNIVRILDSGVLSSGNPYLVMEYINGYSLRRVLAGNTKLSFEFCAHIIESITNALSAAHSNKILHRDIKPENIMLTPQQGQSEHVRLIDFGIARVGDSKLAPPTQAERGIGTILYIAPEQLLGKLEQTAAADIYACATVAYEMLTGKLPFNPNSSVEMFILQREGVKTQPRELRAEIPPAAEALVLTALSFEPSERPQDARVFGQTLANILRQDNSAETRPAVTIDKNSEDPANSIITRSVITKITEPKTLPLSEPGQPAPIKSTESSFLVETRSSTNKEERAEPPVFQLPAGEKKGGKQSKTPIFIGFGAIILAAALGLGGFVWWKKSENLTKMDIPSNTNSNNKAVSDTSLRELSYYLNVQKMRDGKPYEEPFRATGREIFENGYKFKMALKSNSDGYLYLFDEGNDDQGKAAYYLLHPVSQQKTAAQIKANTEIETGYNLFGGGKGTEVIWIIWTGKENETLEAAKKNALEKSGGKITDEAAARQLNSLLQSSAEQKNEVKKDSSNQTTVVSGPGDILIHRVELEHK